MPDGGLLIFKFTVNLSLHFISNRGAFHKVSCHMFCFENVLCPNNRYFCLIELNVKQIFTSSDEMNN